MYSFTHNTNATYHPPPLPPNLPYYRAHAHTQVHHIECVTESFVEYLQNETMRVDVFVNPSIMNRPQDKISTTNQMIAHKMGHGDDPFEEYKTQVADVTKANVELQSKLEVLMAQLKEAGIEPKVSGVAAKLGEAKSADAKVNT